jgi:hypothetical protein
MRPPHRGLATVKNLRCYPEIEAASGRGTKPHGSPQLVSRNQNTWFGPNAAFGMSSSIQTSVYGGSHFGTNNRAPRLESRFFAPFSSSVVGARQCSISRCCGSVGLRTHRRCGCTSYQRHHHMHRAHAWCGIYMSSYFGKADRRLALARQWAREGSNARSPGIGVVVVWAHHVGVITGRTPDGQWIVHSGNDGGAVRTRPRSIAGAIVVRRL